jgi:hypothetical protein
LGSQYGAYTQDYPSPTFYTQDEPLPQMSSQVGQTEAPYRPVYEAEDPHEVTFGPGASDQGPSQERLFGEVQEEAPPPPSRGYTPLLERERLEEGRGKRTRIERRPYTPPSK